MITRLLRLLRRELLLLLVVSGELHSDRGLWSSSSPFVGEVLPAKPGGEGTG